MVLFRCMRPFLRWYFKHPRLFLLIVSAVVMVLLMFLNNSSSKTPLSVVSMISLSFGTKNKPGPRNTDFFIPRHEYLFEEVKEVSSLYGGAQCLLLDLDPFSKEVEMYQKNLGELQCTGSQVTDLSNGVLTIKGTGLQEVSYQSIQGSDDPKAGGFILGDRMAVVTAQVQLTTDHSDSIAHFLGKCIHPLGADARPGVQLVLYDICNEDRLEFTLEDDGTLRHKVSGFCVGPKSENAELNKALTLTDRCDDSTKFKGLENGFLQHMSSEMCVHFQSLELVPPNDVPLVFYPDCENNWKMRFGWSADFKKGKEKKTDINTDVADDFIQVDIQYTETLPSQSHVEYHLQVSPKFALKESKDISQKPNMLVIMLHSVSNSHFRRKLPKTYAYLKKLSGTVFFKGFSVFDESSRSQLSAMLSGIVPSKIPDYNSFDDLPWLHTLHQEQGYVTLMSEDKPCSAQFSDSLCSFKGSPVDHFAFPFWSAAFKTYSPGQNTFCLSQNAIHNITLSYLRNFMTIYTKLPKYALAMFSELSSWNINGLGYLDEDLARFLAWLKIEGHLDNTILTVFSDHGPRSEMMRKTLQGKLEERNPYLSITIPPKSPKSLLDSIPHLRKNSLGIVTPYDLYATMRRMVPSVPHRVGGMGENLLEPIADISKRSCEDLKIPKQWCPCLSVHKTNEKSTMIQNAGKNVIEHVNKIVAGNSEMAHLCQELQFSSVNTATTLSPTEEVMKFKWSRNVGKCTDCEPVYGNKIKSMLYVLYIEVKQGVTLRAIVNITKGKVYIHPHIVSTQKSKFSSCWKTQNGKTEMWKMCVCK